jgi:pimeloyl-ACP methyl ester carboxylesterase
MYPEHMRALVLDAPVPPVSDIRLATESQFAALLRLQQVFFADCAAGELDCPAQAELVFDDMIADGQLPQSLASVLGSWKLLLSTPPGREIAARSLRVYAGEVPPEMPAGMPTMEDVVPLVSEAANWAVNCADDVSMPLSAAAGDELVESYQQRSAIFWREAVPALTCSAWQVRPDPVPAIDFEPRVPPLVIGGAQDILAPYELAQQTSQLLEGARLLRSNHYGHSALAWGDPACVLGRVRSYLNALELPPAGSVCESPQQ